MNFLCKGNNIISNQFEFYVEAFSKMGAQQQIDAAYFTFTYNNCDGFLRFQSETQL